MSNTIITGNLDIISVENEEMLEGELMKWQEIMIHGDPEGLRSFAQLLLNLADKNQNEDINLPIGAREHYLLRSNIELSKSSTNVIVGRLDAKGSGKYYDRFLHKD